MEIGIPPRAHAVQRSAWALPTRERSGHDLRRQARDLDDRQPRLLPDVERDADQPLTRRTGLGPAGDRVALRAGSRLRQAVDCLRQLGDQSVLRELLSHLGRLRDEQARDPDVARRRAHVERAGHVSRLRQRLPERHPARRPSRRQPVRPLLGSDNPAGDHLHRRRSDVHSGDHDPPAGLPRRPAHPQLAVPLGRGRRGRDDLRGVERLRAPAQTATGTTSSSSPPGTDASGRRSSECRRVEPGRAHVLHAGARRRPGASGARRDHVLHPPGLPVPDRRGVRRLDGRRRDLEQAAAAGDAVDEARLARADDPRADARRLHLHVVRRGEADARLRSGGTAGQGEPARGDFRQHAQAELDRLELPRWPAWDGLTSAGR